MSVVLCPRCGTSNVERCADPWGGYTGPCANLYQCLDGCEQRHRDDGAPFTFDPRDSMHCACCGECDRDPYRPVDYLASLCDWCAAGSCSSCDGYVAAILRTDENPDASLYAADDGIASMSTPWCDYLTLTSEDCCNV